VALAAGPASGGAALNCSTDRPDGFRSQPERAIVATGLRLSRLASISSTISRTSGDSSCQTARASAAS